MKLKNLTPILLMAVFTATFIDSCSPTITPIAPTTLELVAKNRNQTNNPGGVLMSVTDTNNYIYRLSCGCAFPLAVDAVDSSSIVYDVRHLKDTSSGHTISAFGRSGLTKGTYTGFLAITTIQPITTELLKDTLRDTVIVP